MGPLERSEGLRESWLAALAIALGVALAWVVVAQARDPATANHDVAWLLYAGGRLLDGDRYGVDVIEHNPPLSIWIPAGVSWLGRLASAAPMPTYNLLVLGLVIAASGAIGASLRRTLRDRPLAGASALLIACASVVVPSYSFGQRDHLIFLLLAPAIFAAARSAEAGPGLSLGARVLVGLCTAAAIATKPYYAGVWLGVELTLARGRGILRSSSRPENAVAALALLLYAVAILVMAPGYLEVARDAMALYGLYDVEPQRMIRPLRALPLVAAGIALLALRPAGTVGRYARLCCIASALSLGVVVWQSKGLRYHHLPSQLFGLLSLICTFAAAADAARLARPAAIAWVCGAIALTGVALSGWLDQRFPQHRAFAEVVARYAAGEPVLFFANTVDPTFPVVTLTGARSASPHPALWQIPGYYTREELDRGAFPYRRLDAMGERERRSLTQLVDRMLRLQPGLLLFDQSPRKWTFGAARFDFARYYGADPRFPRLLAGYRHFGRVGNFEICMREDAAPGSLPCAGSVLP